MAYAETIKPNDYRLNNWIRFFFLFTLTWPPISFYIYAYDIQGKGNVALWLGIFGLIGIIVLNFGAWFGRYEIEEYGIVGKLHIFKKLIHQHKFLFKNITVVNEDSFLFAHFFHVIGEKRTKRIFVTNAITNWRYMLREIVLRVNPKAYVDDKTLEYAGLTRADIGKLFKNI